MRRKLAALFVLLVIATLLAVMIPWNTSAMSSHANPAQSYADSVTRIESLKSAAPGDMNPVCRLQFMTHGEKVKRAIAFVHGYTTCPQQFSELGKRFFDLGYNVLIAPLPYHGLANRMNEKYGALMAEDLTAYADETVDILQGLGEEKVMVGISAGGVITSWAAEQRKDIDLAVVISPAFGAQQVPAGLTTAVINVFSILPDAFEWWDPALKEETKPSYAYPRYSRHALAQTFRLGLIVRNAISEHAPAARSLILVTNANDKSVNRDLIFEVSKKWSEQKITLRTYDFEASLNLDHDLIDPTKDKQRIDIVYPKLIELIDQPIVHGN